MARGDLLFGVLLLRSSLPEFPLPVLRMAELLASQAVTALLGQSDNSSPAAVAALAAAIDARDNYTHTHSEQVVALSTDVARRLGLSQTEVEQVRNGATLHDVGKVAIPNEILYKPGPLTVSEWEVMREHPVIGERILRRTPELQPIALIVRHEHERWDGGGYPDGLAEASIPIGSRIVFACDAYSAMITARPYREPMSHAAGGRRASPRSRQPVRPARRRGAAHRPRSARVAGHRIELIPSRPCTSPRSRRPTSRSCCRSCGGTATSTRSSPPTTRCSRSPAR